MLIVNRYPAAASAVLILAGLALGCASGGVADDQVDDSTPVADEVVPVAVREVTVPAGTVLTVEFLDSLSSETEVAGNTFTARVVEPVLVGGEVAIAAGDEVLGTVIDAVPVKKIGGQASLNLDFNTLRLASGEEVALAAGFVHDGKKQAGKDAATIGGATAGGALLGRIIGHRNGEEADGTAIGAVVGAAVGTAIAASNEGDPVEIPSGTVVAIRSESALTVPVG